MVTAFFFNSEALVFFQYQLINPYRPVWSNLAIGIGKIHYRSTSRSNTTVFSIDNNKKCFLSSKSAY